VSSDVFTQKPTKTFGTLTHRGGHWQLRVAPHVAMELKRLFPGYRQDADGAIGLSDNPETAFKLAWALLMFPLEMNRRTRKHLDGQVADRMETRSAVEQILNGGQLNLSSGAYEPALELYPHQKEAAALATTTGQLLLLDETGAMKTGSILSALANPDLLPALVVAPPHLQKQWLAELHRFFPMLRGHIVTTGTVYDPAKRRGMHGHDPDVLIISYGRLAKWADHLRGKVRTVAFEEAHELRHAGTHKHAAARQIAHLAALRTGLTATPVFNYGDEIFNIIDGVIAPGILGERREFYAEWCTGVGNGKYEVNDPAALGSYLRDLGIVLKRTLEEVGINLPGLLPMPFEVEVAEDEFNHLAASAEALARQIVERAGTAFELMQASGEFDMRMRKITGVAKARPVAGLCKMLLSDPSVDKLVLFGWHRDVYDIWLEQLAEFKPLMYTGSESPAAKHRNKDRFIEDASHRVLIVSLRSGAGLDGLQFVSHTTVHGELDWSPAPHTQGDGRLDRPGQTMPVLSYRPYCEYGTDPLMLQRLAEKRQQADGITDPDRAIFEPTQADPDRIRRVAEDFLARAGGHVEDEPDPQLALEAA
jgi:SNF2 family DNA or RNA helicase